MKVHIRRVSIWSAAKVGCLMTMVPLFCIATFLVFVVISPSVALAPNLEYQLRVLGGGSSAVFAIVFYAVVAGIAAAIGWAITAFLYNVVALLVGGIEVDLRREHVEARPPIHSQFDAPNESWQQRSPPY